MRNEKQILLVKDTKNNKEVRYKLENYRFDISNNKIKTALLKSLSIRYNSNFDIVIEI